MGKFPEADRLIAATKICMKCKARNPKTAKLCRKCGYRGLRQKNKDLAAKKG